MNDNKTRAKARLCDAEYLRQFLTNNELPLPSQDKLEWLAARIEQRRAPPADDMERWRDYRKCAKARQTLQKLLPKLSQQQKDAGHREEHERIERLRSALFFAQEVLEPPPRPKAQKKWHNIANSLAQFYAFAVRTSPGGRRLGHTTLEGPVSRFVIGLLDELWGIKHGVTTDSVKQYFVRLRRETKPKTQPASDTLTPEEQAQFDAMRQADGDPWLPEREPGRAAREGVARGR